ncbi:uncharacterized protein [Choristoneura fumiferana]|uniref:uncharacterized protein n=1 Tax=Choristoneura fumiferana TaxID=7141 RepID=UPI003D15CCFE
MSIGTVPCFDPRSQEWEIFRNRVKQFLSLNDIKAEEKKRAVLITHLSDDAYLLLRNLSHPKEVETSTFDELVDFLDKHLTPTRATFADLGNFYNAVQAEEESVEDWAARLRGLAVHCAFGDCLDKVYRDRFVLGLKLGSVRDRLCEQDASKLTFAKALEIAKQTVTAREARATAPRAFSPAAAMKEEPLLWSGADRAGAAQRRQTSPNRCAVCGMKGHAAERCRYKNYRCQRCKEKGHLKKMCGSKEKPVKNINLETDSSSDEAPVAVDCRECKECQLFNLRCVDSEPYFVTIVLKEGATPKFCKARPLPFAIKDKVEAELERLVEVGILEPVNHSDYATPIVPVPKSNGSIRVCADYSVTLNNDIYVDKYPLPRIEEIFAKLSNGQQYSKLDCSQAYNQLRLSEESQKLTTINTTKGLFKYKRLVFGLACAPAIFQRTIENLLAGIDGVTVFLDDVCVTGPTKALHLERLEKVFQRFQESGLRLEQSKCSFFQDSVTYLGHIISKDGLQKSPKKVEAIVKVPKPTNITDLKRFLGMANYYRNFVPNASSILAPLHELLREGARWEWTERQQAAFDGMKRELSSSRVLAHFDPAAQLVLTVDAGPAGLGAVLATVDAAGRERPLAFGSRSLLQSERNYSQLQKEATAIVFGVKRFHQYLYGRRDPFILKTDHKPLLAIFGKKGGISVTTASRLCKTDLEVEDGCLLRGHRVVIPTVHRKDILQELHRTHQGIVRTKSVARSRVWWPGVDRDIEQTVGACRVCATLRPAPPRAPPQPWPRPPRLGCLMRYVSNDDVSDVRGTERRALRSQASSQSVLSTPFQLVDDEGLGDDWQDAVEGVEQVESVEPVAQQQPENTDIRFNSHNS